MTITTHKRLIHFTAALAAITFLFTSCKSNVEPHADGVIDQILETREAILKKLPTDQHRDTRFITFWDFDGTIQKGDCTEGLIIDGKVIFEGLAQKAVEAGLVKEYPPGSYEDFKRKAELLDRNDHIAGLLIYPRVLEGKTEREIISFSESYFNSTLKNYFFATSIAIIEALKKEKIDIYVLSASADVYVKGSAGQLGIPNYQIRGITMKTRKGKITLNPQEPVTHGAGKTEIIKQITTRLERLTTRPAFILAGFGNSYGTDGDFLAYIVGQKLPAGKAVSVMINGGPAPEKYQGLFLPVKQVKIILP